MDDITEPRGGESFDQCDRRVSIEPYRSPEYFALERARLFGRVWLNVAHIREIPDAGDYVVRRVEVVNATALIVHGRDGVVRAFFDVCSHRGSPVSPVGRPCGNVKGFRCRYHAWTYDLDGSLRAVPDEKSFHGLEKNRLGLTPINCQVWEGFVFLNFEEKPSVDFAKFIGEFGRRLEGMQGLTGFPLHPDSEHVTMRSVWRCNWKLATSAFNEAYHIRTLHPRTIGNTFASQCNPFGHPVHMETFGPHRLLGLYGNSEYLASDHCKVEKALFPQGLYRPRTRQEMGGRGMTHPAMNKTGAIDWSQDLNCFFPNFYFQVQTYGLFTMHWWPLAHDATLWEATIYFPRPRTIRQRIAMEYNLTRQRVFVLEDAANLEQQQQAISAGPRAKREFNYSEHEALLFHQHQTVQRFVEAEDPGVLFQ